MANKPKQKKPSPRSLPRAEASWTVDPLSDLVSATELAAWRRDITTAKILRYLSRWRAQVLEHMGEGQTIATTSDETATLTVEASAKAQLLKDLLTLEAKDLARFYGLDEPQDKAKEK